jgi:DNA-binding transcriptional LysR family regulator
MLIRHLHYLSALAKERHFARAAVACHVTQPTLSAGIKQLEETIGVLIVERGQRFIGLTAEGERVLSWAQRVLADYDSLTQELGEMREGLAGRLRIGAIPVALPVVQHLTREFGRRHPQAAISVRSVSSIDIQRGLDDFSLDVGLTYLDNEPLARIRAVPLYRERYWLVMPKDGPFAGRQAVGWAEAATLPLGLFTPDMQNRRIVDMHFREAGAEIQTAFESNSLLTLWSHLPEAGWSSVLPQTFLPLIRGVAGLEAIPLSEPDASHAVGLVVSDREPPQPMARALLRAVREIDLAAVLGA